MGEVELTTVPWIDPAALWSRAEIGNALSSVTAAEQTALMKIAKHYANASIHFDADELVHEALSRVLDGRQAWPKYAPAIVFLAGVIRSIAREWMSKSDPPYEGHGTGQKKPAEGGTLEKIDAMKIVALFNDPITQKSVRAMMDGAKREELEQLLGLNSAEYEINRKKIRRRIEKLEAETNESRN